MKRREFIALVGGAAVAWPSGLRAQSPLPRIGYLLPGTAASHGGYVPTFLRGLDEVGLVRDRNFVLDLRYADGKLDLIPTIIDELIGRGVKVLVVGSTRAGLAAKQATASIPIVFVSGDDPVNVGLVTSLSHPGGNVTGINLFATEIIAKRLDLVLELVPAEVAVGALFNPANPNAKGDTNAIQEAAQKRARQLTVVNAATDNDVDAAFARLVEQRAAGLLVHSDPFLNSRREKIVALAARHAIAGNYPLREYVAAGGLSSYGVNFGDSYRQAGTYAGKIINGANPADLPVLQPTKFEMVLNLKTAKALGLTVSNMMLVQADEVIE
jgi:ABC-type uncharacterized transport system substrate-binding protein